MILMLYLLTTVLLFLASFFAPWWSFAPVCFLMCFLLTKRNGHAFWSSFLATFTVWSLLIIYYLLSTHHLLADRMAKMLGLPGYLILALVSAATGALAAGLSGLCGWQLRQLFQKPAAETRQQSRHRFVLPELTEM